MSYIGDKLRTKTKTLRLGMVFVFACSFWWPDSAVAGFWSCSQPPNDAIEAVIAWYPTNYLVTRNEYIVRIVESSLEQRLGFKSKLVSCNGSTCRIGEEFINFIGESDIDIPARGIEMSVCSAHNSGCGGGSCKGEYPENYDVIYAWKYGSLRLTLDLSRRSDQLNIDKVAPYDPEMEPRYEKRYARHIGVTKSSRLFIEINNYSSDYFD